MGRKSETLRMGSLPKKVPNRHRLGAWQPPFKYPEGEELTRQQKSDMLNYYNSQLDKARHELT